MFHLYEDVCYRTQPTHDLRCRADALPITVPQVFYEPACGWSCGANTIRCDKIVDE